MNWGITAAIIVVVMLHLRMGALECKMAGAVEPSVRAALIGCVVPWQR